jgi:DNA-binding NarL/FixJ family response regulator
MLRVLLVENDALLRSTMEGALGQRGVLVVAACADADEALAAADRVAFDVLLTDLDLGTGPNGIVIAHALRRQQPDLGVVVLTSYRDPRLVGAKLAQLPDGADYVLKHTVADLATLVEAMDRAVARMGSASRAPAGHPVTPPQLTDAQTEILRLVALGLTNAEIARARSVTEASVERTINRIAHRLGVAGDRTRNPRVQMTRAYYALSGATDDQPPAS